MRMAYTGDTLLGRLVDEPGVWAMKMRPFRREVLSNCAGAALECLQCGQ